MSNSAPTNAGTPKHGAQKDGTPNPRTPNEVVPLWELIQTSWVVARGFASVFAEVGLSPSQFGVLVSLSESDLTQAELARQLMMRPQSMGELVGSLLERGLVSRAGPSGRGRRSKVGLTDLGRQMLRDAWPSVRAFNAPEAIGLSRKETEMLVRLLRTLRRTLFDRDHTAGRGLHQ